MYAGLRKVDKIWDWEQTMVTIFLLDSDDRPSATVNDRQTLHTLGITFVVIVNLTLDLC